MDSNEFNKLRLLLEPCQTPDELHNYIRYFLKLDLPWDTVDPDSTSAPLKFVWAVYHAMLTGKGPTRHVVAAARNTTKTLTSSVVQFLSLLHFRRDGAHIASILDQSLTSIRYLDQFMSIPELMAYRHIDNVRIKKFTGLPANDYTTKSEATLRVVTATKKGANSPRASLITLDEVDLTPASIISEVAYVADPTRDGHKFDPVFVYLSSRKSNDGPIQALIDEAQSPKANKRIRLHKWSTVDFMEKCPEEIHKPELGRPHAYIHTETLDTIWGKETFDQVVGQTLQSQYKEVVAYEGCKTCPAFTACQGHSASQRGESTMLRTRQFVGDILSAVGDPAVIIAQSLNWTPEKTALVFKSFSHHKHVKDFIDFYEWVNGERYNPDELSEEELDRIEREGTAIELNSITPDKQEIYKAMKNKGWHIHYGVDWGYNPDPAVVVVAGYHRKTRRVAVLHIEWALNHANSVWAQHVAENVWRHMPGDIVAPDMADPASPTYFAKFNIPSLDSKPPRIETGVSFVRALLWNPITQKANFAVLDDGKSGQNSMLIDAMMFWTHKKTASGWDYDKFEDNKYTHSIDSLRYLLHPFVSDLQITLNGYQPKEERFDTIKDFMKSKSLGDGEKAGRNAITEFFAKEHGLTDLFSKEKKIKIMEEVNKFNNKEPQNTDPEDPPPDKGGGKSRLKYSF